MFINLNTITKEGIIINQEFEFNEDNYKTSLIKGLKNVQVKGKIYNSTTREVLFEGHINGTMILQDSNSNELVDYNFKCNINEILAEDDRLEENLRSNSQNSLDLKEILWQNIVLEVPLQFSIQAKPNVTKGEGWELVSENDKKIDPRLEPLKALLDKGKE